MQTGDHDHHDDRKVWLNEEETQQFLDAAEDTEGRIAFGLGLRRKEVVEVTPRDITEGPAGWFLRVEHGKGDKYRETPLPDDLATTIQTLADLRGEDDSTPLVDVSSRTIERGVSGAADDLADCCSGNSAPQIRQ